MKQILLAYLFVCLLGIAGLSILSYGHGAGYVYLYWREWQLQTTLWFLAASLVSVSFLMHCIWYAIKQYRSREKRKTETVFSFSRLHPYEQLAVIWLLNAAQDQRDFIQQSFTKSGLLKHIIDARLSWGQQQYTHALTALNQSNPMAFELAELQRIEIYLSQQQGEQALTHLEFLNQHELSPWLIQVKTAYEQRLVALWGVFAMQFPWLYLRSTQYGHLDQEVKKTWLEQLLLAYDQATQDDLFYLQQRYLDLKPQIFDRDYSVKLLWLKLLFRMPEMSAEHEVLAIHLMEQQFNQDVFYLWFQQQLLRQNPDYDAIAQQISHWETKYPALPVLSFAKWHVLQATGYTDQAQQLLDLYPDDIRMSYLRIKAALQDREDLLQQLNAVFESNVNFIEIKT
ncbi:heme biosynthesis protein HemY [Acinetobacter lwoffii]|uniref:membrane protein n=1 Tax=Acinetobacter lwoffii TaxID=28090 RepID=UPI000513F6E2|nr:membrane protein [Acinetobacter lwoffii]KGH46213.1 membrane protein [Acinetobacter idrijaensis]MCJ0928044.1 heme biosynthesis protein HemY [Acinetobacter lwoffii]MCO8081547.1 heme biosynthesis protein HemY [Acinetobacter lwoffii]QXX86008.1 heme biosynthesis protein HemY [Acinetobacter lwoffii]